MSTYNRCIKDTLQLITLNCAVIQNMKNYHDINTNNAFNHDKPTTKKISF